ncbi:sulfatase family protein [Lacihabitans lacunae]|uniref:Sulfatase n=1 Tax=Lacihabitans lacunae TaxID=1028214 RepID=A0ABV7YS40_9BACT
MKTRLIFNSIILGILLVYGTAFSQADKKPNVVYILTDQWRSSALGYAGDPNVKTPNLDKFSKESVNFTNAVSVTPVCTPHRSALLTGRYPTTTGMFLNDTYLPSEELCMAEIFKAEGYNTAYLGKWHLDGHGRENNVAPERRQGFDYWKALECSHDYNHMPYYENNNPEKKYWEGYSPFALADDAKMYMANHAKDQKPFLLFISIATPHFPHDSAPKEYKALYPKEKLILNPNVPKEIAEKVRVELQGYYGHCTATDAAIGQVLDKLKDLKIDKNTIVVFSADHGEMMGGHGLRPFTKQLAWDESIKVPFLIKYPKIGKNKGKAVHAPINTPDILPSILGLADIAIPNTIEGENLASLIKSPNESVDRAALLLNIHPFTSEFKYPEYRAIRTKQYSYIKTLDGSSKLFDNKADPYQLLNLYDNPAYAMLQNDLESKLQMALNKIGDDFQPKEYYLKKWNFVLDKSKNAIDYWSFDKGNGVMQTPKLK